MMEHQTPSMTQLRQKKMEDLKAIVRHSKVLTMELLFLLLLVCVEKQNGTNTGMMSLPSPEVQHSRRKQPCCVDCGR